jgi:hypothetical protein
MKNLPKMTNMLFALAFVICCFGLWLMLVLFQSIYPLKSLGSLPGFTHFIVTNKFWLLFIPVPFLLFSTVVASKKTQPATEINLFYLGILAVISLFLLLCVGMAVSLPWIPMVL